MKKQDFFECFKEYLLEKHRNELYKFIYHYETMLQQKEKLQPLLDEEWNFDIRYKQSKNEDFGGNDKFIVFLYKEDENDKYSYTAKYADHYYEIEFGWEDIMCGYCLCKPEDVGYVKEKKCCGVSCDWESPFILVRKIIDLGEVSFNGKQRDLWELEKKWGRYLKEYKEKQKQDRIKYIDEQIKQLENEKQQLLSE